MRGSGKSKGGKRQKVNIKRRCSSLDNTETPKEIFERELAEGTLPSLPCDTFLICAAQHVRRQIVDDGDTLLFAFVRLIRAHPELKPLAATKALARVEQWLSRLEHNGKKLTWELVFEEKRADAVMAFIHAWDNVYCPAGHSLLGWAIERAKHQ